MSDYNNPIIPHTELQIHNDEIRDIVKGFRTSVADLAMELMLYVDEQRENGHIDMNPRLKSLFQAFYTFNRDLFWYQRCLDHYNENKDKYLTQESKKSETEENDNKSS